MPHLQGDCEYYWVAYYDKGERFSQFKEDGSENRYGDIDRARLKGFALFEKNAEPGQNDRLVIGLHLGPDQRLVARKRNWVNLRGENLGVVWLVGWQETRKIRIPGLRVRSKTRYLPVNSQAIFAVFPDGHIEVVNRYREDHPWFYSINPNPKLGECEAEE
jgi:hypothetical protein